MIERCDGVIVGGTPGTILYLCSYDICKERLSQLQGPFFVKDHFINHLSSGLIAETIACVVYVPVDVIKERLQVQYTGGGGGRDDEL
jgi:hypothetical protein